MDFRSLIVTDQLSHEPEIGGWLWALEDTRRRTLTMLAGISAAVVDWFPPNMRENGENSIGTLLYHIALVEADWLYCEVLETEFPPAIVALFPHDIRDDQEHLTLIQGVDLADHLARLAVVRDHLLQIFQPMTLDDFCRVRHLPTYDVTPHWVLHHLIQHEAEHRGQMATLRSRAEGALKLP